MWYKRNVPDLPPINIISQAALEEVLLPIIDYYGVNCLFN